MERCIHIDNHTIKSGCEVIDVVAEDCGNLNAQVSMLKKARHM
ncbi:hypothetical protein [Rhizobium quercicola]|nr:hypothetical protein [Rhizobium quercicola]